jgi:hypothetical protein
MEFNSGLLTENEPEMRGNIKWECYCAVLKGRKGYWYYSVSISYIG